MPTRPPIPSGRPPPYAFVGRMYRRNLRPVVIACGVIACIWTLVWGISEFQSISVDQTLSIPHIVTFDIILGALYCATAVIEAFGVFAAVTQRLGLVRLYTLLSLVAALVVLSADVITVVLDFVFRKQLLQECEDALNGATVISRGWWGTTATNLTPADAASFCSRALDHNTFADFAWLFVSTILALMFSAVAFAYYRQLLDPSSMRAVAPSTAIRLNAFPSNYPPPAGPPPTNDPDYVPPYDPHKVPEYDFADRELGPEKAPVAGYSASPYGKDNTNPFERRAEEL